MWARTLRALSSGHSGSKGTVFFGSGAPTSRFRSTGRVMPQLLSVMDVCSQRNSASAVSLCPGRPQPELCMQRKFPECGPPIAGGFEG